MQEFIIIASLIFTILYSILLLYFYFHIHLKPKVENNQDLHAFSIIIPFRNEQENLQNLFENLKNLNYPKHLHEIIFVDDESTDLSVSMVNMYCNKYENARILYSRGGKKTAIYTGVQDSKFEWIACTDADCLPSTNWLRAVSDIPKNESVQLILGAVFFKTNPSFFSKVLEMEFSGLMASTAGSALSSHAIMANGASIFFRRDAYNKVITTVLKSKYASGDDAFLMSEIQNNYDNESVVFCMDSGHQVLTEAPESFKEFLHQRLRWSSKSHAYGGLMVRITVILVLFANFSYLSSLLLIVINETPYRHMLIVGILLKTLSDYLLVKKFRKIYNRATPMGIFLITEIFIPLYYLTVLVLKPFVKTKWKGRNL